MSNIKLLIKKPHIGLDADTTCFKSRVQRYATPVIIVRMTLDGNDVPRNVRGPMSYAWRRKILRLSPMSRSSIYLIREE